MTCELLLGPAAAPVDVGELLRQGGWIAGLILSLSVALLATVIGFAVQLRKGVLAPEEMALQTLGLLRRDRREARRLLGGDRSPLARVLLAGLNAAEGDGGLGPREAMADAGAEQSVRLGQWVDWLGLIAAIGPMLGFLGTVAGMIGAFAELNATGGGAGAPELAGQISKALVTTYLGLIVGMAALVAHRFYRNRVSLVLLLIADWAEQAVPLLQRIGRERADAV